MSNTNNTTFAKRQEVTRLSRGESTLVADIEAGKVKPFGFTYTVPITTTARCVWCLQKIAPVTLTTGHEINLDIEAGDHGQLRAVLTSPHNCPESERWDAPGEDGGQSE